MTWAPNYATAEELAAYVRIGDSEDDAQLDLAIAAASRAIDKSCGRQFGQVAAPEARCYTAKWDPSRLRWAVDIDDLMTDDGLTIEVDVEGDGSYSGTVNSYLLRPVNAAAEFRPWTRIVFPLNAKVVGAEDAIRVTARWGWSEVPDAVKQACLMQASRVLSRRDAPFGVAGSPDSGSEVRLLAKVDPDVEVALSGYKRPRWVFA